MPAHPGVNELNSLAEIIYSAGDFNSPGVIRGVRFAPFQNVNEGWLRTIAEAS